MAAEYIHAAAVTPNDDEDLANAADAISAAGAGNVVLVTAAGETATVAMAAGQLLPLGVVRVKATDTTATGIVALRKAPGH